MEHGINRAVPVAAQVPPELKERAVQMVFEAREQTGQRGGALQRVASQLGMGVESLRLWVNQAEVDGGHRPGTTTADAARISELEQQNRELRRANEILRSAAVFFAGELDPRPRR